MFLCHSGFHEKKENNHQPELINVSYQVERMRNDLVPGAVMIHGSGLDKELNTVAKCNISG
jgi:hypothetical protein